MRIQIPARRVSNPLIIALKTSVAHQRGVESFRLLWITESPLAPPITLLAPALNEEKSIRLSIRNLLELDYPELEVIVINDVSKDRTLQELQDEFKLRPIRMVYVRRYRAREFEVRIEVTRTPG